MERGVEERRMDAEPRGVTTSAKSSSPRRQTRHNPRKSGPASPARARRSYSASIATETAPGGGHARRSYAVAASARALRDPT
ncbi:hypothetical protein BE20_23455 [Sorangium cellulosum]|nr:hypothetical protein BE20_23455 [Sorangium cellulosum]